MLATDVMSTFTEEMQRFACEEIFPRLGRVTTSEAIALDA
ncbi:hypothetical protein AA12467_2274 [Gluconobacter sphaericus NBRC 12467]|nr:hypothetical protein AA12467_2274 [Gluconobacter sphaericus NBRC 12467]